MEHKAILSKLGKTLAREKKQLDKLALEMHRNPNTRICRPRQVYVGANKRDFVPMDERG